MEKVSCGIVQDLLPSYCDGLTREAVSQMMQEHLEECPQCQKVYEDNRQKKEKAEMEELSRGRKFSNKLMNIRYYIIGFLIGLLIPIVLLIIRVMYVEWMTYFEIIKVY